MDWFYLNSSVLLLFEQLGSYILVTVFGLPVLVLACWPALLLLARCVVPCFGGLLLVWGLFEASVVDCCG